MGPQLAVAATASVSRGQWAAALFLLAGVLVLGLGGLYTWWRRLGARAEEASAEAEAAQTPRVCPTCVRRYPAAAQFCAVDASALVWVEGRIAAVTMLCPRCERTFDGARFCAFDAEELVRSDTEADHRHVAPLNGADKICPVCAARYEVGAAFCGRDGTRLCPLH